MSDTVARQPRISPSDIEQHDVGSWELFKGTALSVRPGSICKVTSDAYANWGIELSDDNTEWLRQRAAFFYLKDQRDNGRHAISLPSTVFRDTVEREMISAIVGIVKEVIRALDDGTREFRICDLGTRVGKILSALATIVKDTGCEEIVRDRTTFSFVDPLPEQWESTGRLLDVHGLPLEDQSTGPEYDSEYLARQPDKSLDLVISFLHLHNKPFLGDLPEIHRVLKDDGALLIGDWHSALWHSPQNVYILLEMLGADAHLLTRFKKYFDLPDTPHLLTDGLNDFETAALADHLNYWATVGKVPLGERKLYYLAAQDTSRQRVGKLKSAGFDVDLDTVRKAFPRAKLCRLPRRMLRDSDFATVMLAVKRRRVV